MKKSEFAKKLAELYTEANKSDSIDRPYWMPTDACSTWCQAFDVVARELFDDHSRCGPMGDWPNPEADYSDLDVLWLVEICPRKGYDASDVAHHFNVRLDTLEQDLGEGRGVWHAAVFGDMAQKLNDDEEVHAASKCGSIHICL